MSDRNDGCGMEKERWLSGADGRCPGLSILVFVAVALVAELVIAAWVVLEALT